jgi:hypothetical protein
VDQRSPLSKGAVQALIGVCVIALSLDLAIGTTWDAVPRGTYKESFKSAEYQEQSALIEVEVRDFRRALDLTDSPPRRNQFSAALDRIGQPGAVEVIS